MYGIQNGSGKLKCKKNECWLHSDFLLSQSQGILTICKPKNDREKYRFFLPITCSLLKQIVILTAGTRISLKEEALYLGMYLAKVLEKKKTETMN